MSEKGSKQHERLIQLNLQKTDNPVKICSEEMNRHFSKEDMQMANRCMKRCSTLLVIRHRQVASILSDSVRPYRRQPTRLPCPWDSPGKNTGVGCHFLLQCMNVKKESEVSQSCLTPSDPMDCSPPGSSVHGIFQARVLEWVAIAFSLYTYMYI